MLELTLEMFCKNGVSSITKNSYSSSMSPFGCMPSHRSAVSNKKYKSVLPYGKSRVQHFNEFIRRYSSLLQYPSEFPFSIRDDWVQHSQKNLCEERYGCRADVLRRKPNRSSAFIASVPEITGNLGMFRYMKGCQQ